jgi:Rrf2 family protein
LLRWPARFIRVEGTSMFNADLSHTIRYAVEAMVYLASLQEDHRLITGRDIGRACGISIRFVMKLLGQLAAAGLLYSAQGPGGGYRINRPANRITLLDIVAAVDGPITGRSLLTWTPGPTPVERRFEQVCKRVAGDLRRTYSSVRLSDLAANTAITDATPCQEPSHRR